MQEQPLVSIIIPTYNRAHLIGETLDSVLAQTYQNWECIVVDDGSTDNTDEVMAEYMAKDTRFQYYHRPKDRLPGGNAARNYGFEVSKGEYIQWFDSDDLMLPEKLEIKVKVISEYNVDFVVCEGAEMSFKNETPIKKWNLYLSDNILFDHLVGKVIFGTNGPMFKKAYLKTYKLFNESLEIKQEWEFFNRLLIDNPSINIVEKVLYLYRVFTESKRGTFKYTLQKNKMKAHRLVLDMLIKNSYFSKKEDFLFRKYFQTLFLNHFKISLKYKSYKDTFFVLESIRRTFSVSYLYEVCKRIIKKPWIIKNLFYNFSNFK